MSFLPSNPPQEDSQDLTDLEVKSAVVTKSQKELSQLLAAELSAGKASVGKGDARYALTRHELRRKGKSLFYRAHLGCPGEPDKILVFRVDWIQQGVK